MGLARILLPATSRSSRCAPAAAASVTRDRDRRRGFRGAQPPTPPRGPPATGAQRVANVMIGKRLGRENRIAEPTFQFAPQDTVFISVGIQGAPAEGKLSARWLAQTGKMLDSTRPAIAAGRTGNKEFHLAAAQGLAAGNVPDHAVPQRRSVEAKTFAVRKQVARCERRGIFSAKGAERIPLAAPGCRPVAPSPLVRIDIPPPAGQTPADASPPPPLPDRGEAVTSLDTRSRRVRAGPRAASRVPRCPALDRRPGRSRRSSIPRCAEPVHRRRAQPRASGRRGRSGPGRRRRAARRIPAWAATPIKERVQVFYRYKTLLERHLAELGALITEEHGKIRTEAEAEILKAIELTEFACSLPQIAVGEVHGGEPRRRVPPGAAPARRGRVDQSVQLPLDGAALVVPQRHRAGQHVRPEAVGAGAAQRRAHRRAAAGGRAARRRLQRGARRTRGGGGDPRSSRASRRSASSARPPVAKEVYRRGSAALKRVLALGGAKNHVIVMPDADPEMAAGGVLAAMSGCTGQRCMAASVMVAVSATDHIVERLAEQARGDGARAGRRPGHLPPGEGADRARHHRGRAGRREGAGRRPERRRARPRRRVLRRARR